MAVLGVGVRTHRAALQEVPTWGCKSNVATMSQPHANTTSRNGASWQLRGERSLFAPGRIAAHSYLAACNTLRWGGGCRAACVQWASVPPAWDPQLQPLQNYIKVLLCTHRQSDTSFGPPPTVVRPAGPSSPPGICTINYFLILSKLSLASPPQPCVPFPPTSPSLCCTLYPLTAPLPPLQPFSLIVGRSN